MKRQLIFDGQLLQTDAWHRGMGRYMLQLLGHLDSLAEDVELYLIFNENIDVGNKRYASIRRLCPGVKQVHAKLPIPTQGAATVNTYKRRLSEVVAKQIPGDNKYYIITSLFLFDFYAQYPEGCKKAVIFYDLTPLLFWKDLGGFFPPHLYMARFQQIYEADVVLTISETVRQDVLTILGISDDRVYSINGGFTKSAAKSRKPMQDIPERYVLFVSGDLPHKNNEVAAEGFARYSRSGRNDVKLMFTSNFSEISKQNLRTICPDVVFTGNVSDEELEWLYEHADTVLFASKYEGLGIPILDAVHHDKPIVASDIPVFKEMSENAFYFFALDNPGDLARSLHAASERRNFEHKHKAYPQIMKKYSWGRTILSFKQAVWGIIPNTNVSANEKRLAIVALHPGIPAQVGRTAEPLYPYFSPYFDVDYYFDSCGLDITQMERPTFLDYLGSTKVADIDELTVANYRTYETVIYLVDDRSLRYKVARTAAVLPGMLVYDFSGKHKAPCDIVAGILVKNARSSLVVQDARPAQIAARIRTVLEEVPSQEKYERIIRSTDSNSAIMKRLLKNLRNDS